MFGFCEKTKGAISVFLTLILLPPLLPGGLTTDAARIYMSKVVISDAGEMAMNAGLAQYETELHDEYGLFSMEKTPEAVSYTHLIRKHCMKVLEASSWTCFWWTVGSGLRRTGFLDVYKRQAKGCSEYAGSQQAEWKNETGRSPSFRDCHTGR